MRGSGVLALCLTVWAVALTSGPSAASASVTIGPEQIVVSAPGAAALITRAPFGIVYTDGGGLAVLSEVASGAAPQEAPLYAHSRSWSAPTNRPRTRAAALRATSAARR